MTKMTCTLFSLLLVTSVTTKDETGQTVLFIAAAPVLIDRRQEVFQSETTGAAHSYDGNVTPSYEAAQRAC